MLKKIHKLVEAEKTQKILEQVEEIENSKSYDFESFVSGVGGFIGIFLGYSILQIPELLGLRVVNGCPRCTLCGNDLTPNVLRTKNFPVLKHPATARLRRR